MHFKKIIYYMLFISIFFAKDSFLPTSYKRAMDYCESKEYNNCLNILFDLELNDIKYNYEIAEIYLNDFNNHNIALYHFGKIINFAQIEQGIDLEFLIRTEGNVEFLNAYKKSLFMYAYLCSNYLGMYTEGYEKYKIFLKNFSEDELVGAVEYELDLLESKEISKKSILNNNGFMSFLYTFNQIIF